SSSSLGSDTSHRTVSRVCRVVPSAVLTSGISRRLISGGRLLERNESATLDSSGVRWGSRVDSLTLYWTNRPGGDSARAAAGSVCSADQADQVSSASPTLPLLACTATAVPAGESARHESAPKRLRNLVS